MNKMKYIIVDNGMYETPVIFGEEMDHAQMASDLIPMASDAFEFKKKVVSAGFVCFSTDGLYCYGQSVSLKLESRPKEDAAIINRMIGATDDC